MTAPDRAHLHGPGCPCVECDTADLVTHDEDVVDYHNTRDMYGLLRECSLALRIDLGLQDLANRVEVAMDQHSVNPPRETMAVSEPSVEDRISLEQLRRARRKHEEEHHSWAGRLGWLMFWAVVVLGVGVFIGWLRGIPTP